LFDKGKLFSTYINILPSQHFIARFENFISIPNIRAIIDETHITLTNLPNKKVNDVLSKFDIKHFDKTLLITIACCVFHNYCEM
jgi:hypothetical protein